MPGYGYAKLPRPEREALGRMADAYLAARDNLRVLVLILDIRRDVGDDERRLVDRVVELERRVLLAVTKADKLSKRERKPRVEELERALGAPPGAGFCVSSHTREGIDELWQALLDHAAD
jgi:GTP-binding protein